MPYHYSIGEAFGEYFKEVFLTVFLMTLHEMQAWCKKTQNIKEEQMWDVTPLYIILDLPKDDFCKIVDLVGLDNLIAKKAWYERLETAEQEYRAKETYKRNRARLETLEAEQNQLRKQIEEYEQSEGVHYV